MVLRITRLVPTPCEPTLVTSSGPKRRENASCASSPTSWPRKISTECSSNAARVSLYAAASAATSASVTPRSSAAKPGPSGMMSIGELSLRYWRFLDFPPNRALVQYDGLRAGQTEAQCGGNHVGKCESGNGEVGIQRDQDRADDRGSRTDNDTGVEHLVFAVDQPRQK